jgi:hypothetical protein
MSGNQELFQAFNMFKQSVQEFGTARAIYSANDQVNAIKASDADEAEKRSQLQGIANNMVAQLAAVGTPASTIQQVASAFGPKHYSNPSEAAMDGALSGNQGLVDAAAQADKAMQAGNMAQLKMQQDFTADQNEKNRQAKERMFNRSLGAKLQAAGQKKGKQSSGDVNFAVNANIAMKEATKLENLVKQFGGTEVWNSRAAARMNQAQYQLAINYAKVVDPESVAREGEVAAAQKYMVPMGMMTRNSVTLESIAAYKEKIREYLKARHTAKQGGSSQDEPAEEAAASGDDLNAFIFDSE